MLAYYVAAISRSWIAGWDWATGQGIILTWSLAGAVLVLSVCFAAVKAIRKHHSWRDAFNDARRAVQDFLLAMVVSSILVLVSLFVVFFVKDAPTQMALAKQAIELVKTESEQRTDKLTSENAKIVDRLKAEIAALQNGRLFLQCDWSVMPTVMPPSGEIFVFEPHSPDLPEGLKYSAALGKQFAPPGSAISWTSNDNKIPAFGNKCQVFDYGSGPVFDVNLVFNVSARKVNVNEGGGKSSGDVIQSGQWIVPIPKIDEGASNPFVFYFFNRFWSSFVQIDQPPLASIIRNNNAPRQSIEVVSAAHNQPIWLNPGDLSP